MKAKAAMQHYDLSLEDECLPDATCCRAGGGLFGRPFVPTESQGGAPRGQKSLTFSSQFFSFSSDVVAKWR